MRDARGCERRETPVFHDTCRWLDEYFKGREPGFMPNCRIEGATPFRRFALDELGAGEVRFAVTPINCFGARGKPLVSAWNMI